MSIRPIATLAAVLLALPACLGDGEDSEITQAAGVARPCAELVCGNTNAFGVYAFYELDETRRDYSPVGGMRIKSFQRADSTPMKLRVDGDMLGGQVGNGGVLGPGLIHSKLVIESSLTTTQYEVEIQDFQLVEYVDSGSDDDLDIPTYALTVTELYPNGNHGSTVSYCGDDVDHHPKLAIVSQGDRYDPLTAHVTATGAAAEPWFNIACYDDAIWKATVMRYHEHGSTGAYVTAGLERTAMMESIRADYCHTGRSYTHQGVALEWTNDKDWLSNGGAPVLEAVWDGNGALCLNKPRAHTRAYVPCADEVPTCDDLGWGSFDDGGYLATYSW